MNPNLQDKWRLHEDVFDLLWSDVLSLGKLEDVLGTVDDLD